MHLLHQKRLEENYEKARKRAKKKGRDLPPRDDYYYYYWGTPYLLYAPFVYPAYCVCPIYYDTTTAAAGSGFYGACAAGTCGGTVAAGACGGSAAGGCGGSAGAVGVSLENHFILTLESTNRNASRN